MRSQRGLTLIELMISIVISSIVLAGVSVIFVTTLDSTRNLIAMTRLEQDVNSAILIMTEDIRRAGYWGPEGETASDLTANPFQIDGDTRIQVGAFTGEAPSSCVKYSYNLDRDTPTVVDNAERFGFRLQDGELRMYRHDGGSSNDWDCSDDNDSQWLEILDSELIEVSNLTFYLHPPSFVASQSGISLSSWKVDIDLEARLSNDSTLRKSVTTSVLVENLMAD